MKTKTVAANSEQFVSPGLCLLLPQELREFVLVLMAVQDHKYTHGKIPVFQRCILFVHELQPHCALGIENKDLKDFFMLSSLFLTDTSFRQLAESNGTLSVHSSPSLLLVLKLWLLLLLTFPEYPLVGVPAAHAGRACGLCGSATMATKNTIRLDLFAEAEQKLYC